MAVTPVPLVNDGDDIVDDFPQAVRLAVTELQTATIVKSFQPPGIIDAAVGVPQVDWINLGNITVPAWATSAIVQMNVSGVYTPTGTTVATLLTAIGTAVAGFAQVDTVAANKRTMGPCWAATVATPPAGAQPLKIRIQSNGPNILRADGGCSFSAIVTFKG